MTAVKIEQIQRDMFTVLDSAHDVDRCEECASCARGGKIHASVTGSVGSTYRIEDAATGKAHFAIVHRVREDGSLVEPL